MKININRFGHYDYKALEDNIEMLNSDLKGNEFIKIIINFINSDKKRPISLPPNIK